MNQRLPENAFEVYLAMGSERSYQALAQHFGVSKRCISQRARKDRWQERLASLVCEARATADARAVDRLAEVQARHATRLGQMREAVAEVMTPQRVKALVATMFKAAVQKGDIQAARILLERLLGKPRSEALPALALDLPDGLQTAADIRIAANALLQGVADGSIAPEDAQKAAALVEGARKSIETEDLERRISELEESAKKETGR